ncbi:hypothetical protein [Microbulbifer sp. JTAC008]|uniref:hypothetical protein n=1 Tax=unclassified Microbulbifer TaxID=2619833 RepID=UPI004039AB00
MEEIKQFKCLTDLRDIINQLDGFYARPTVRGQLPTLYPEVSDGRYRTVCGVRVCDYTLSEDGQWVFPDDQMGLSFSASWQHLKSAYKMVSRGAGKNVDVFWVLSKADIPEGMSFQPDRRASKSAKGHYLLTVNQKMKTSSLVEKLKWVANRMAIIKDAGEAL